MELGYGSPDGPVMLTRCLRDSEPDFPVGSVWSRMFSAVQTL